jgi:hypothetical protein
VSTVIQKFLDSAHAPLLREYLEAVSQHPAVMRPAYAAVLISLYVQLRDREGLNRFLKESIDAGGGGYRYDVPEAVDSCLYGTLPVHLPAGFGLASRGTHSSLVVLLAQYSLRILGATQPAWH